MPATSGISAFRQINQRFPSGARNPDGIHHHAARRPDRHAGGRQEPAGGGRTAFPPDRRAADDGARLLAAARNRDALPAGVRRLERSRRDPVRRRSAHRRGQSRRRAGAERLATDRNEDLAGRDILLDVAAADRDAVRDMLAAGPRARQGAEHSGASRSGRAALDVARFADVVGRRAGAFCCTSPRRCGRPPAPEQSRASRRSRR